MKRRVTISIGLLLLGCCTVTAHAADVLLVIAGSSPGTHEAARKSSFESWGHTVTTIQDSSSQAAFDTAVAAADVVYIPASIQDWELDTKVSSVGKGLLNEHPLMDVRLGFSTSLGWTNNSTFIEILDNSHPITSGLVTGSVTITSSSQPLSMMNDTIAAGMTILGENSAYTEGEMLGAIDQGGSLAGGGTASGRRVRLPWGNITWSALNGNGLLIAKDAIDWASGNENQLLIHWKLDETSGSTAVDSSTYGRNGTTSGTTSWVAARRNGGIDVNSASKVEVAGLLGNPTSFTIAAWINTDSVGGNGGVAVSVGEHISLVMDEPNFNGGLPAIVFNYSSSYFEFLSGGAPAVGAGWRHYVGVFDSSANTLKLYIDGQLVATKATTREIDWASSLGNSTVAGGNSYPIGGYEFDGRVDDFRVYGTALNDVQVAEIYGLIAHWKLDESSGATAVDASLAGNDATRTGTEDWGYGVDEGAHRFDYTDGEEYFEAPTNDAITDVQEGDYTLMAYFRPGSVPPGSGSDNDSFYGILVKSGWHSGLVYSNAGEFHIDHWLTGDTYSGIGTWGESFEPDRYYHIAGVVSRTDGTVKLYVDGELKASSTFTPGTDSRDYGNNPWRIAMGSPGGGNWGYPCDGMIDDVRIYNRALSEEELAGFDGTKMLAHWAMDELAGTAVADSSGEENNAAFNTGTPTWTPGVRGGALEFDGSNDVRTLANFDPPAFGTVAFWLRPVGTPTARQRLIGLGNTFEIWQDPDGPIHFDLCVSGGVETFATTESMTDPGRWRHIVVSFDSNTDGYSIYVDGKLDYSTIYAEDLAKASAALLSIGTSGTSTQRFIGALDDLRIYNYELSETEVAELYGLIGHWKMDEGAGTTLADSTAFGNDASIAGATWTSDCVGNIALEFDGLGDTAATISNFDPPPAGAVAFWFQSKGQVPSRQRPWGVGSDFEMWIDNDGLMSMDVATDGYQGGFITTDRVDDEDRWYHVVAQYDASDQSYSIYLNGELHKSGVSTWVVEDEAANILTFGTRTGNSQYWEGTMRDFRIYNRHLVDQEIAELSGMIARWKFEESSGTVAADAGVLGNNASFVNSPALGVDGPFVANTGNAVEFDGSSAYVDSGQSLLDNLSEFTLMGWIRPDSTTPLRSFFGQNDLIEVGVFSGQTQIHFWTSNGGQINATVPLALGKWHHVAAVGDGAGLKLYFNGNEVSSGGTPVGNYGTSNYTFKIAEGVFNPTGGHFDGRIDDVRVYRRAMCPEEIFKTYRGGRSAGVRIIRWVETR